jgi:hypothetical protein
MAQKRTGRRRDGGPMGEDHGKFMARQKNKPICGSLAGRSSQLIA